MGPSNIPNFYVYRPSSLYSHYVRNYETCFHLRQRRICSVNIHCSDVVYKEEKFILYYLVPKIR
eukprot:UN17308